MMTFDQAVQRYAQLRNEVLAGRLSQEQFVAELANLQVQDQAGTWWRPDPATGNWLYFDGATWRPYQAAPSPTPQPTPAPTAMPAPAAWAPSPQAGGPMAGQKGLEPVRLSERTQKIWGVISIVGGIVGSLLWVGYSSIREGADWGTGFLMIAIPIFLAVLRKPIDSALMVFQPIRRNIPRIFLVGAGMAAPYVVGFILYHAPIIHLTQYPFMRATMVLGTLAAYVILRTPPQAQMGEGVAR